MTPCSHPAASDPPMMTLLPMRWPQPLAWELTCATTPAQPWKPGTKTIGSKMNAARLRMARIPDGADLIDNPVSGAPGFTLKNVHVMAGVPSVFKAMVASVFANPERRRTINQPIVEHRTWRRRHCRTTVRTRRPVPGPFHWFLSLSPRRCLRGQHRHSWHRYFQPLKMPWPSLPPHSRMIPNDTPDRV